MSDTPLIPTHDLTVYAVLEDFGKHGCAWREIDEIRADERSIVEGILRGEYERVLRVVAFNADEGWARDVTRDIALKVARAPTVCGALDFAVARTMPVTHLCE